MKQIFKTLIVSGLIAAMSAACTPYDDTDVKNQLAGLDKRVTALEEAITRLNTNISALASAVDALKNQDTIEKVEALADGTGWTVTFSQSGVVTIYHGIDGIDGTNGHNPVVSIAKDTDDEYYWTIDGEFVLVNGEKVKATAEVAAPQLDITPEGILRISYDGGLTWNELGQAGISSCVLENVTETEDDVKFLLSDGKSIVIPKGQTFALNISTGSFPILAGVAESFEYTVTSSDSETIVDGFGTNGYEVVVESAGRSAGKVTVTAPDPVVDGKIFILAINSKGTTSAKIVYAQAGYMNFGTLDATAVTADGATLSWQITTNVDYTVTTDASWVTYKTTATGVNVTIGVNVKEEPRSATVTVKDKWGVNVQTLNVVQVAADYSIPGYKGPIEDWRDDGAVDF